MPTLWTPANLATPPVAWFDAQDASTFTFENGNFIAQWRSKVGAITGAGTGTSVGREATAFPGGYPAAVFAGGGTQPIQLSGTDGFPIGTADGTIVAVAAQTSSGFYPEVFHYGPTTSGQQRQIFATGGTSFLVASNNGRDGNTGVDSAAGTIIVGAYIGGNLVRSYSNGDPTPYEVSGAFNTGSGSGAIGPGGWYGSIGEVLVLAYVPTLAERQQIEGYCAWRWGRQAALPAAHPYKAAAPTVSAPSPSYTFSAAAGSLSVAGRSARLARGFGLPAVRGQIVMSGQAVTPRRARILPASAGLFALTSPATAIRARRQIPAGTGGVTLGGRSADLRRGFVVSSAAGSFATAGQGASFRRGFSLAADRGSIALSGSAAMLRRGGGQVLNGYAATVAGPPVSLRLARVAPVGAAAFAVTYLAAALRRGFLIGADRAGFAVAGADARLLPARAIVAGRGTYTLTSPAVAGGTAARRVSAARGGFAVAGSAELRVARVVPAIMGGYATTGGAAGLIRGHTLLAALAGVLLTSNGATLRRAGSTRLDGASYVFSAPGVAIRRRILANAETGTFAATPSQVATARSRRLIADAAAMIVTGSPIGALRRRILPAARAALKLVGGALTFARSTSFEILPANRFVIPARQRRFVIPARQRAFIIRRGVSMSPIKKSAAAECAYSADWEADLAGAELVGQITATSTDPSLIVDRITYEGTVMRFWLRGGTPRRRATIVFVASTTFGEHPAWEQAVIFD